MPSPNNYFDCVDGESTSRHSFINEIEHDLAAPPWDASASSFTFDVNVGTSATGPFTPAGLSERRDDPCPIDLDNSVDVGEFGATANETAANIAEHNGAPLVPGTDYWVEWVLRDGSGTEVDRFVCGPYAPAGEPSLRCLPIDVTDTSANMRVGVADGSFNFTSCSQDQFTVEWGPTVGPPWANTVGPNDVNSQNPGAAVTGLTPNTEYFYRTTITNPDDGEVTSVDCSIWTADINCSPATDITDTTATFNGTADNVQGNQNIRIAWGTAPGVYDNFGPNVTGAASSTTPQTTQNLSEPATGLTPGTTYYYAVQILSATGTVLSTSDECTVTTDAAAPTAACAPATAVTDTTATFNGTADNAPTDGTVRISWGTATGAYPNNGAATAGTNSAGQAVSESVTGLTAETDYFYVVEVLDAGGAVVATSAECTARTTTPAILPPAAACAPATAVTDTTATLNGTADNAPTDGTVRISWGTAMGVYDTNGPGTSGTYSAGQPVTLPVTGLTAETEYFYVVEVLDAGGTVVATSPECTVTTTATPIPTPTASCAAATAITATGATMNGTAANAPTDGTVRISWGTATGVYGTNGAGTAGTNAAAQPVALPVTGLTAETQYFYVVEVLDAGGAVVATSAECTVTTTAAATPPVGPVPPTVFRFVGLPDSSGDGSGVLRPLHGLWTSSIHVIHPELGSSNPWSDEATVNAGDTPRIYGMGDDSYVEATRNGVPDRTVYEGVQFESRCGGEIGCYQIGCLAYDCEDPESPDRPVKPLEPGAEFPFYQPVALTGRSVCSNFGHASIDYEGNAIRNLIRGRETAIEQNLWSGDCAIDENGTQVNGFLENIPADELLGNGNQQPPGIALGILDQALAECNASSIGMIHVPAVLGARLLADGYIYHDTVNYGDGMGERSILRTSARGNIVVIGSGYGDTVAPEGIPMYATSMVYLVWDKILVQTGESENTKMLYTPDNRQEVVAEQIAGAFFDPCCHFGVLTDICL